MINLTLLAPDLPLRGAPVLIADPDMAEGSPIVDQILRRGHPVALASEPATAIRWTAGVRFTHALVELRFRDEWGFDLIEALTIGVPSCRVLVHSAFCDVAVTVRAVKRGASDVLPKPLDPSFVAGILFEDDLDKLTLDGVIQSPSIVRKRHITSALIDADFKVSRAARVLSMNPRCLYRYLNRQGIARSTP
jgi:ActR/RegA family two-component response regulator